MEGGVPARTLIFKLGNARGTKNIVYKAYLISMIGYLFIVVGS